MATILWGCHLKFAVFWIGIWIFLQLLSVAVNFVALLAPDSGQFDLLSGATSIYLKLKVQQFLYYFFKKKLVTNIGMMAFGYTWSENGIPSRARPTTISLLVLLSFFGVNISKMTTIWFTPHIWGDPDKET